MVSGEEILEELAAIGFARVTDYLAVEDGNLTVRDWALLQENQKAAIASVEKTSAGLKVKFYDKMKALELLGKMLGLFDSGVSVSEENNLLDAIVASTGGEVDTRDLPEVQQAADDRDDLVEPAEAAAL